MTDRNSLIADVLEEVADAFGITGNIGLKLRLYERAEVRRSTSERAAPGVTEEDRGRAAYQVHLASGRHMDMVMARMLVDTALTAALAPPKADPKGES